MEIANAWSTAVIRQSGRLPMYSFSRSLSMVLICSVRAVESFLSSSGILLPPHEWGAVFCRFYGLWWGQSLWQDCIDFQRHWIRPEPDECLPVPNRRLDRVPHSRGRRVVSLCSLASSSVSSLIITNMGQLFGFHVSPNCPMRYCYCCCILFVLDARMPGSRQTVSSLLTPRESHPAAPHSTASREYHCLPCGLSRKESGTARYFKSVVVARCRLAGRGVPLHTLFYLRSARGKYLTSDVQFSKYVRCW